MRRRTFLGAALASTAAWKARAAGASQSLAADFEALWQAVDANYAYFDRESRARWRDARARHAPVGERTRDQVLFIERVEAMLDELRDDNVTARVRPFELPTQRRSVPYELDVWPRWREGAAVIEAVRTFGDADVAGLRPGQVITKVDGVPVEAAMRKMLADRPARQADMEWALRRLLAGPLTGVMQIAVRDGAKSPVLTVKRERNVPAPNAGNPMYAHRMGEDRDIGYIRHRLGAPNPNREEVFEKLLAETAGTRALILDVRGNAGPEKREITLAVLAHFATGTVSWQQRQARGKPRVRDTIEPGASIYRAPVAVLVDRWTAGEGEALAAGMRSVAGARLIGTAMAQLRGEQGEFELPYSGIRVRFPTEHAFTASGAPRESIRPDLEVDLAAPSGGPGDPILYQALKLFERR